MLPESAPVAARHDQVGDRWRVGPADVLGEVGQGYRHAQVRQSPARLASWHAAWVLDQGALGLQDSSRAKVIVSEATWRVLDRCVQALG